MSTLHVTVEGANVGQGRLVEECYSGSDGSETNMGTMRAHTLVGPNLVMSEGVLGVHASHGLWRDDHVAGRPKPVDLNKESAPTLRGKEV